MTNSLAQECSSFKESLEFLAYSDSSFFLPISIPLAWSTRTDSSEMFSFLRAS